MQLEKLLLSATSASPRIHFPMEEVCGEFCADAATLWLYGELDRSELVLAATYNRPELENEVHKAAFRLDDSFLPIFSNGFDKPFFYMSTAEAGRQHWDNGDIREYTVAHFKWMLVLVFYSESVAILGTLIFYFIDEPERVNDLTLRVFSNVLARVIETSSVEYRRVVEERRKIGHEIGRLIKSCEDVVDIFETQKVISKKKRGDLLDDLRSSLQAARASSEKETFIEGVLERKEKAKYVGLWLRFFNVSHTATPRSSLMQKYINESINIPRSVEVKMSEQDLDLLISNLVSNAQKYSTKESFVARLTRGSLQFPYGLRVSNPSASLPEAEFERVWRYRYRGANVGPNDDGDGIGLSVVSDICGAYGIRRQLYQRQVDGQVWTYVSLKFPREICRWNANYKPRI